MGARSQKATSDPSTAASAFAFGCSTAVFPADELAALAEHGARLEGLATGAIKPVTAADKRFLRVDREEIEPTTLLEQAWMRRKGRREYEREQAAAPPPPEAETYGIVEFDADRCWW